MNDLIKDMLLYSDIIKDDHPDLRQNLFLLIYNYLMKK